MKDGGRTDRTYEQLKKNGFIKKGGEYGRSRDRKQRRKTNEFVKKRWRI